MPHELAGGSAETLHSFYVTWITREVGLELLVDAFEAFMDGYYGETLVPAQAAVEFILQRALVNFLSQRVSSSKVRSFLGEATYAHQLEVVLPTIMELLSQPLLPTEVLDNLRYLRGLRNKVAHGGLDPADVTEGEARGAVCASLFGVKYLQTVGKALETGEAEQ